MYKSGLDKIFAVIDEKHDNGISYCFDEEARVVFNHFHDGYYLEKKKLHGEDDNRRGVLSKSLGYVIRLSGIITAIDNASTVIQGIP